ncbi:MAG: CPBP family intramembrane metalloprotease [Bacteroidales bacterium]|jgi:membrane protease YdiL (CAAX protease family)|nr:CPBP family intramembrane metalloprotease [Bacteroidales bacterium]
MLDKFDISRLHPFYQLLTLLLFVFLGMLFSSLFSMAIGALIWGGDMLVSASTLLPGMDVKELQFLKFTQAFIQIGTMLIPPIAFSWLYRKNPFKILQINKINNIFLFLVAFLFPFLALWFVNLLGEWNLAIKFPQSLAELEARLWQMESFAREMTLLLLRADTVWGLLLNLLIIAVIPAVSEEFLFRGAIQNVLKSWFKNAHWAIIVTAIIFSAIHGQFFGFLPRVALGVMLGYLLVYTHSIWAPVIAHFVNNAVVVIVSFLEAKGLVDITAEEFGQNDHTFILGMISLIATTAIIYLLYGLDKKRNSDKQRLTEIE